MPHRDKRVQVVGAITAVVLLLCVSVGGTLYMSGNLPGVSSPFSKTYQNVTLTDAYVTCENLARDNFAARLKSLAMDDHSSRLDVEEQRYKIFINVELYEGSGRGALSEEYFVNCFVRSDNGSVSTFDYAKDDPIGGGPASTSNPFGFPR